MTRDATAVRCGRLTGWLAGGGGGYYGSLSLSPYYMLYAARVIGWNFFLKLNEKKGPLYTKVCVPDGRGQAPAYYIYSILYIYPECASLYAAAGGAAPACAANMRGAWYAAVCKAETLD